jgi:sulfur-oxidizing protein SoxB
MVRVGGMTFTCAPGERMGGRISDMRLHGKPLEPGKPYKVAGWAPVAEGVQGEPIWEVVVKYLKDRKVVAPRKLNVPRLVGVGGNPGLS